MSDVQLGYDIHKLLVDKGIESPMLENSYAAFVGQELIDKIAHLHQDIMELLRLDMRDDSLKETPNRVARMYVEELFWGLNYDNFPKCTVIENKMNYDEIIVVKDISVNSTCEHHFIPFRGRAHIGYIPNTKVLGLSKFNRIVDFFSRRPQVQERLTEQIFSTLEHILETNDIMVVIKAEHMCVSARGIKDQNSVTITSKIGGRFASKPEVRAEVMWLIK